MNVRVLVEFSYEDERSNWGSEDNPKPTDEQLENLMCKYINEDPSYIFESTFEIKDITIT